MHCHGRAAIAGVGGHRHARRQRAGVGRHRDGVDHHQGQQEPRRLVGEQSDQQRHRGGGEHHRRDGAMPADPEREFIAENARGHREHGKQHADDNGRQDRGCPIPHRHEGPERDEPGPDAVELEAMRAIAEHEAHGVGVLEHRREIQQAALRGLWLDRPQQQADRQHHQRAEGRHQECGPPAPAFRDELRDQERQADAERKARRVERDRARRIAGASRSVSALRPGM